MKQYNLFIFALLISILCHNKVYSQAAGDLYHGALDDGYSAVLHGTNLVCIAPIVDETAYHGALDDGYSAVLHGTNLVCVAPIVDETVYHGALDDGYSAVLHGTNLVCVAPIVDETVYHGALDDGYSGIVTACIPLTNLPIQLLFFTAKLTKEKQVLCEWETATEINNNYFTVWRSVDALKFEVVGKVKGTGTTSNPSSYEMLDEKPYKGTSYYKLQQTDYDGKFEYFPLAPIYIGEDDILNIYPNPVEDFLTYEVGSERAQEVYMLLINALGQKVLEQTETIASGKTIKRINVAHLSRGCYILRIVSANNTVLQKQFMK